MKPVILFLVLSILTIGNTSCRNQRKKWRTDANPILRRFPFLSEDSTFLWRGGIHGSRFIEYVPGPSTYYIHCFVINASVGCPKVHEYTDYCSSSIPEEDTFPNSLDYLRTENVKSSPSFSKDFLGSTYSGDTFYFETSDILYIRVIFE